MHSPFSIPLGPAAARLRPSGLDPLVMNVTLHRPPMLGVRTLSSERTAGAHFSIASVEQVVPIRVLGALQLLSCRTGIAIGRAVVAKFVFPKDALAISRVGVRRRQIRHMRPDSPLLTCRKIGIGAVLSVADYNLNFFSGVLFVLLHQLHQFVVFSDIPRCRA